MKIKRIEIYNDIGDLFEEQLTLEEINNIDPEIMFYLHHINDFEPLSFMVVNNDTVITFDNISGDAFEQIPITDFINESIEYAAENI